MARKSTSKARKATRKAAKVTRKAPAKRAKKAVKPAARKVVPGFISHTELVSLDPAATRAWAEGLFGWKFNSMPMPTGEYHNWALGKTQTGGGIRSPGPGEAPGTCAYIEVTDMHKTYAKALAAGAKEMMPPMQIMEAGGWIAVVQAPGGMQVGFWAPK